MPDRYRIKLNILGFESELPSFCAYRKLRKAEDKKPETSGIFGFSLPVSSDDRDSREKYWVTFDELDGFEQVEIQPRDNVYLTNSAIFYGLRKAVESHLSTDEYEIPKDGFYKEFRLNFDSHAEGVEQLIVQPYFLKATSKFGLLMDFHFRMADGVAFSRRIQQLSLSLDRNFKRNLNYYLDRVQRINRFVSQRRDVVDKLKLPGTELALKTRKNFESVPAKRLRSKVYQFANGREGKGQFVGLKRHGPLEALESPPVLLFAFREQDRQAARILARALQGGGKERYSFPGFDSLFKVGLKIDAKPIILDELCLGSFQNALKRVEDQRASEPTTLPVFVLPEGDDNGYLQHKAVFTNAGIPTQVCTTKIINDDYALKWSVGNIALQLFCKAGGKPWKVKPTSERTLIMGISQAHKLRREDGETNVERHFAFSVLSDNSGLFQQIQVLGDAPNESDYLSELKENLSSVLKEKTSLYDRVVIHTSFKLKRTEIRAIEDVARSASGNETKCRFAVVKVNHRSRFFGINPDVNSLVPFEATEAKLAHREYLIWFEGIFPDKQTVSKAFPGPTHIQMLRITEDSDVEADSVLQDLINLSGANWRGFNAKSAPVSIFYCHLIADLVSSFQENGLPLPQVTDLRPWFL